MRKVLYATIAALCIVCTGCGNTSRSSGIIKTDVPERPAGQEDMLGFAADPIEEVGVGVVGLGMRGGDAVQRMTFVPGAKVAAVCDVVPERVEASLGYLSGKGITADGYTGYEEAYKELCEDPDVDLVYICTDWKHHVPVALYAMEHGKHVAIEVPSATTLQECWDLVNTSERTRKHCMVLENCCYDFFELSTLAFAQAGLFGDVIHAEGSYHHNLDEFWDAYWNNWRLDFNRLNRGDVYPTHGFGPVCQVLNIHRGDRLKTLVAMDTDSFNGKKHVEKRTGKPCEEFANGDETMTMIRTELGKSILIEHDVMTPRPYDRMYQIVGTDGYAGKYPVEQVLIRPDTAPEGTPDYDNLNAHVPLSRAQVAALREKYPSPILTPELVQLAKEVGGHGGMDFIMDYRLIYCLNHGLPLDMDVYDLAEWCSVVELSRISMDNGCAPVEVPDFTRGNWNRIKGFSYAFAEE